MTKQDLIEMLATNKEHATKLRPFKKADLERFVEAQTDPTNHEVFPVGSFVYCEWADSKGIVTHTEKIPGGHGDRYSLRVKTGSSSILDTHSGNVIRVI